METTRWNGTGGGKAIFESIYITVQFSWGWLIISGSLFSLKIQDDRINTYVRGIKEQHGRIQLVMCILPTNKKERYDSIKKVCVNECPIPSQMILGKTISKRQMVMSVATKVAMQLNCKLGGDLWAVEIPVSWQITMAILKVFLPPPPSLIDWNLKIKICEWYYWWYLSLVASRFCVNPFSNAVSCLVWNVNCW